MRYIHEPTKAGMIQSLIDQLVDADKELTELNIALKQLEIKRLGAMRVVMLAKKGDDPDLESRAIHEANLVSEQVSNLYDMIQDYVDNSGSDTGIDLDEE
jgi:hypothetical protein